VALGLFDGVHLGHRAVLDTMLACAGSSGLAPLVFTFSIGKHIPDAKHGMTRLMSEDMTFALLEGMGVSHVAAPDFGEFRGLSPAAFVKDVLAGGLGAARVVCGYDYRFGKNASGGADALSRLCGELGVSVEVIPAVAADGAPISSSRVRALIQEGDIHAANNLLGRRFAVDFEVIAGRKLGRTLDWPTINQPFPVDFTVPRYGVYATLTHTHGKIHSSITNVGVKPTVGSDTVLAETYIRGFDGDLYGGRVKVEFLRFLRPERKFSSLEELRAQIACDAQEASLVVVPFC